MNYEKKKQIIIIIENFDFFLKQKDGIEQAKRLYKSIRVLKELVVINFSLIFVSSCACDLPIPKIFINYPSDAALKRVVEVVFYEYIDQNPAIESALEERLEKICKGFTADIVQVFNVVTRKFDLIRAIAQKLIKLFLEPFVQEKRNEELQRDEDKKKKPLGPSYTSKPYRVARLYFLVNPRLSFQPLSEIEAMIDEAPLNAEELSITQIETITTNTSREVLN